MRGGRLRQFAVETSHRGEVMVLAAHARSAFNKAFGGPTQGSHAEEVDEQTKDEWGNAPTKVRMLDAPYSVHYVISVEHG